jgi:glycosyltransferase involved in cell wall biosynthesis
MKKISAIVLNSVSHDTRVLKEADSLASAGYVVTILGIKDNRCHDSSSISKTGVKIIRFDWKTDTQMAVNKLDLLKYPIISIAGLIIFLFFFDWIWHFVVTRKDLLKSLILIMLLSVAIYPLLKYRSLLRVFQKPDKTVGVRQSTKTPINHISNSIRAISTLILSRKVLKREMLKALIVLKPDVVHCHDLNSLPIGYSYSKKAGCKLVFDSHEISEDLSLSSPMQKKIFALVQRFYSNKVDAFITINQSIGNFLKGKYPSLPDPVIIKNAAVPFEGTLAYDGRLHRAAGLDLKKKVLLYQGGFSFRRGLDTLVRSAVLLPSDWCLVLMGWGKYEGELRNIAQRIDPQGRCIRFIPAAPREELAYWTAGGTVGVILYENVCLNHWFCSPNKLWEYPIAGVPILASAFPEMSKVITQYKIGWLLDEPITAGKIAETISTLSEDSILKAKRACFAFIQADNWHIYEKRLIDLYGSLAK